MQAEWDKLVKKGVWRVATVREKADVVAEAKKAGQTVHFGSLAGIWRLPNRLELVRLLNLEYFDPALSNTEGTAQWSEGDIFNNVEATYWSSTTYAWQQNPDAWTVTMHHGIVATKLKSDDYYVWCVRGGL